MEIYKLAFLFFFQFLFSADQAPQRQPSCQPANAKPKLQIAKATSNNLIFSSADGGRSWKDISDGLPDKTAAAGFLANNSGLYVQAGNGIYHRSLDCTASTWMKDAIDSPASQGGFATVKAGTLAYNMNGAFFQQPNGASVWQPVYSNFKAKEIRAFHETSSGTVFIASNNQLFKSANGGKTWKALKTGGMVMKIVEQNGVLLAAGAEGILRSTDDGENWNWVIREGGVGIAVANIKGGFAAITYNTHSRTRRVRTSYDAGNTWQAIDAGLQPSVFFDVTRQPITTTVAQGATDSVWHPGNNALPAEAYISSIVQVGNDFFCGHPQGIFKSSNTGKSWQLVLSSVANKVFTLYVSGDVLYAVPLNSGC